MNKQKVLVVLSGGMDSATLLYYCTKQEDKEVVGAVNFFYGSKHNAPERACAEKLCQNLGIKLTEISMDFINQYFKSDLLQSGGEIPEGHYADENMKKTVVPFRNGIMLSIAAGLAESIGADLVALGNHAGDHAIYPDCRPEFTEAMDKAISLGTEANIKVYAPFVGITKGGIANIGKVLQVPYQDTYTCYKGGQKHCGKCGSCTERKEAFEFANMPDPTEYEE